MLHLKEQNIKCIKMNLQNNTPNVCPFVPSIMDLLFMVRFQPDYQ